jgi:4-hydroxythreonine-4-phosphate dehydrogenase
MKHILITPGEPAGIGPDIVLHILQQHWDAKLTIVADPDLLSQRAQSLGISLPSHLNIIPVTLSDKVITGQLNPQNANYVIQTLKTAAEICLAQEADAIVTGPVHKGVLNDAGIAFTGHTEFFAHTGHVPQTVMLFVVDQETHPLKVALATTHLPLAHVSQAITKERLQTTLKILREGLQTHFKLPHPRILVCGLNPHAGEGGHLGSEEIEIITPTLDELRTLGYALQGPLPADTIFTPTHLKQADVILAMYHDQALPLVKYLGFGHAVNVTLGLPFIRTSVDHGTALDVAGTGKADAGSMIAALKLAIKNTR